MPPGSALSLFAERYQRAYGHPASRPSRRVEKALADLVAEHGAAEIERRIGIMFGYGRKWPAPPYTLATFTRHVDEFVAAPPNGRVAAESFTQADYLRPSVHFPDAVIIGPEPSVAVDADFGGDEEIGS